jgi:hypothetical protein
MQIANEMISQAVWVKNFSEMFQLKFRMPFINDGKVDEGLEDIYENAHKY